MENTFWFRYFLLCNEFANSITTRQGLKRINFAECILEVENGRYANEQMTTYFHTADYFFAELFECDYEIVFDNLLDEGVSMEKLASLSDKDLRNYYSDYCIGEIKNGL